MIAKKKSATNLLKLRYIPSHCTWSAACKMRDKKKIKKK